MNKKELLLVSVTVFCTIVAWIVADLYHISTTQRYQAEASPPLTQLKVMIDTTIIDALEKRQ